MHVHGVGCQSRSAYAHPTSTRAVAPSTSPDQNWHTRHVQCSHRGTTSRVKMLSQRDAQVHRCTGEEQHAPSQAQELLTQPVPAQAAVVKVRVGNGLVVVGSNVQVRPVLFVLSRVHTRRHPSVNVTCSDEVACCPLYSHQRIRTASQPHSDRLECTRAVDNQRPRRGVCIVMVCGGESESESDSM